MLCGIVSHEDTKPRSHEGEGLFLLLKKRPSQSSSLRARHTIMKAVNGSHVRQEVRAGECLRSKNTPAPSWLRGFVRDIPGVSGFAFGEANRVLHTRVLPREVCGGNVL